MHSSLAVTAQGLPLGVAAIKFWSRKKFKDTATRRSKVNFTRIPIEQKESFRWIENLRQSTTRLGDPDRCVHIGDRESDIFELFDAASEHGTHFLVRTCSNRLAGDGGHTVAEEMSEVRVKGLHFASSFATPKGDLTGRFLRSDTGASRFGRPSQSSGTIQRSD